MASFFKESAFRAWFWYTVAVLILLLSFSYFGPDSGTRGEWAFLGRGMVLSVIVFATFLYFLVSYAILLTVAFFRK